MADSTENRQSSHNPTVGWFCTYTPEEVICAAGLQSKRILGEMGGTAKADGYLHPNLCAYVRACLNSALMNRSNNLAGIIGVDSCDAMRRLFDAWRHFLKPDFAHILALPHIRTLEAAKFYSIELARLLESLKEHFAVSISTRKLRYGIEMVNETRSLLQKLSKLRYTSPSLSGKRFYEILREAMVQPKEEFNAACRSQLETFEKAAGQAESRIKIVLAGGVLDDTWMVGAIEEAGGQIVADDMCCGSRYFEGLTSIEEEPLLAISKRYIFRPPCPRMCDTDTRVNRLIEIIERSEARGLIYYSVKFCDTHMLDWASISRKLSAARIPALRCETDYSVSERERTKVRIEAFLEMVRENRDA